MKHDLLNLQSNSQEIRWLGQQGRRPLRVQEHDRNALQCDEDLAKVDIHRRRARLSKEPQFDNSLSTSKLPYVGSVDRENARRGLHVAINQLSIHDKKALKGRLLHADFLQDEIDSLSQKRYTDYQKRCLTSGNALDRLNPVQVPTGLGPDVEDSTKPSQHRAPPWIESRGSNDIAAFLRDSSEGLAIIGTGKIRYDYQPPTRREIRVPLASVLREREVDGMSAVRLSRGQRSIEAELKSYCEDALVQEHEWTDCCGDISAVSWTSGRTFVCGAVAHSDPHNMQYNKPGNLLLGSCSQGTLRAIADHKIARPVLEENANAENASESMRQTQSPWLYTSVVAIAYCKFNDYTFTASFDHSVKVWDVAENGSAMNLRGTWSHGGKVNFVVASPYHEMVATASDVQHDAIRVYRLDQDDIGNSSFDLYTCDRAYEQARELANFGSWAYYPATIHWGRAKRVAHFLLVGFSPRSITEDESEIDNEASNTGELALWNALDRSRVNVTSASTQNVFEVLWHPSQPVFIAATAPCGIFEIQTKTQIRVFAPQQDQSFASVKTLDCPAFDINELTMM